MGVLASYQDVAAVRFGDNALTFYVAADVVSAVKVSRADFWGDDERCALRAELRSFGAALGSNVRQTAVVHVLPADVVAAIVADVEPGATVASVADLAAGLSSYMTTVDELFAAVRSAEDIDAIRGEATDALLDLERQRE